MYTPRDAGNIERTVDLLVDLTVRFFLSVNIFVFYGPCLR